MTEIQNQPVPKGHILITLDNAQSGGPVISIVGEGRELLHQVHIPSQPSSDGIVVFYVEGTPKHYTEGEDCWCGPVKQNAEGI